MLAFCARNVDLHQFAGLFFRGHRLRSFDQEAEAPLPFSASTVGAIMHLIIFMINDRSHWDFNGKVRQVRREKVHNPDEKPIANVLERQFVRDAAGDKDSVRFAR